MGRTSRLLAALALGLALAGVTAAAVAQPTPPTIENHDDPGLRSHKAEEARRAQPDTTLTDDMIRQIEEEGRLHIDDSEPLDLDEIREQEEQFWEESWDEPDEW